MTTLVVGLLLLCAGAAAFGQDFGRTGEHGRTTGGETVCGEWVHLSSYGQGALVEFTYEFRVVLNCNSAQRLKILAADSATVLTNYYVFDWSNDTLVGLLKQPAMSANARDSVFVLRTASGTAPNLSGTVLLGSDFSTDYAAEQAMTAANWDAVTRYALDSTRYIPMLDTTGQSFDGFREPGPLVHNPHDPDADRRILWFGSTWNTPYDSDSARMSVFTAPVVTGPYTFESTLNSPYAEDLFAVWFADGDSLGVLFEDKERGGDSDQVSIIVSADRGLTWTGKTVLVGPAAGNVSDFAWPTTGGRRSPSSPTLWVENGVYNLFVEMKSGSYKFGGDTVDIGEGAVYLFTASSIRGPYTRVINDLTNTGAGDTLVPFFPLQDCAAGDTIYSIGAIPHDVHKFGNEFVVWFVGVGHTLSDCAVQRSNQWPVVMKTSGPLAVASGWEMVPQLSGKPAYDSVFTAGIGLSYDYATIGPYNLAETSPGVKVYLTKAQVFDTTGHPYGGWEFVRNGGDYLPHHSMADGILRLTGEQNSKNAGGLLWSTATAALGDSFEVVTRLRIPDRGAGGGYVSLSIGSGNITDRTDDGQTNEEPVLESGTTLKLGGSTSTLYKMPASGAATTYENNTVPSPATYVDWHELRLANRKTADWQGTHRWTFQHDSLKSRWFVKNANGSASDWVGNSNKLLIAGGAGSAFPLVEWLEVDYLYAKKAVDVDLYAAAGTVIRDSIPVTADTYIYQNAATLNYGVTNPLWCGWPNGGGSTRANSLIFAPTTVVPDTHQILYAELVLADTLRNSVDSTAYLGLFRVTSDWVVGSFNGVYQNGSCSWNNQGFGTGVAGTTIAAADSAWTTAGGDFAPVPSEVMAVTQADPTQYIGMRFDGTEYWRFWQENPGTNFGVIVRETRSAAPTKTISQRFQSLEDGEATDKPYWIVYHCAASPVTLASGGGRAAYGRGSYGR